MVVEGLYSHLKLSQPAESRSTSVTASVCGMWDRVIVSYTRTVYLSRYNKQHYTFNYFEHPAVTVLVGENALKYCGEIRTFSSNKLPIIIIHISLTCKYSTPLWVAGLY